MREHAHPRTWVAIESGTHASLRGLSLTHDGTIWASGTQGTVLRSIDHGASFEVHAVPDAEALDFRSLHALDRDHAIVLSAGSPARAFVTRDGGASWRGTYRREGEGVFFDSLVLEGDREGIALGDPLPSPEGPRFALLVTHDGGERWDPREGPIAREGEAAFAASNACIALPAPHTIVLAAGGTAPRTFRSTDDGATWSSAEVPIAGSASAGIFALAFRDANVGYAIGGDYAAPSEPGGFARTRDGGVTWSAGTPPRGYRSSIAVLGASLVAVGTSGSDVSYDEGASWAAIDDAPLNSVRVLGAIAIAVGPDGVVARLVTD